MQHEEKLKHLELIQGVIKRMAQNSFLIKGWTITLMSALFALASKDTNSNYILLAFLPAFIFWPFFLRLYSGLWMDTIYPRNENSAVFMLMSLNPISQ